MPNNILQQVITYNKSNLALLQNKCAFLSVANKKYQNFDKMPKNLGDTVSFDLPPRFSTTNSLVVAFQSAEQRVQNLVVDKEISTSYEFSAQQFIFNARDYMERFGRSAVAEIGAGIESDVAEVAKTNTFRFYGDGTTAINTYLQLANALAYHRNFGAAKEMTRGILSDLTFPGIVNSGLNQFVPQKNEREMNSWELGRFSECDWYQSNLLATHTAGTEGEQGSTLTVVSTNKNAAGAITSIVFSGTNAAGDADSIKQYDKFQFSDGVAGQPNMRFLTFIGHKVSQSPVQFRAEADAASTGGSQVTVTCYPPLQPSAGKDQNINNDVVAGMQVTVLPSHRCGLIMSGDPLFLAMPQLPEEVPFPTSNELDPETAVSLRMYFGSLFGQNSRGMVHDAIWGKTLVDEYTTMVALPL